MADTNPTFLQEVAAAGRGVVALLIGDRGAARYFDFSQRGLVSSFLALIAVAGLESLAQALLGLTAAGDITRSTVSTAAVYAALIGASALMLRQINRMDALRPYIVTLNWANALFGLAWLVAQSIGLSVLVFAIAIAGFVVVINIGRLVMTLKPLQIAMLVIAQLVGFSVALLLVAFLFPLTPEQLAAIAAASS